jgi:hypothetical protein
MNMLPIAERLHANGWRAVVLEDSNGDVLVACAFNPAGERYDMPGNDFQGGGDDYKERFEEAQRRADQTINMAVSHDGELCDCPPWARPTGTE